MEVKRRDRDRRAAGLSGRLSNRRALPVADIHSWRTGRRLHESLQRKLERVPAGLRGRGVRRLHAQFPRLVQLRRDLRPVERQARGQGRLRRHPERRRSPDQTRPR
jgi:hypothetical protein